MRESFEMDEVPDLGAIPISQGVDYGCRMSEVTHSGVPHIG
jgi:hypothetical protein